MRLRTKVLVPVGAAVIVASATGVAIAFEAGADDKQAAKKSAVATGAVDGQAAEAQAGPAGQNAPPADEVLQQPAPAANAASSGLIAPGTKLAPGQSVVSPNGKYTLILQPDGNLVLKDPTKRDLWATQTHENPGAVAQFDTTGNLTVTKDGRQLWRSATSGVGKVLAVQDDANVVIFNEAKKGVWSRIAQAWKLYPGQALTANQWRTSPNGKFQLVQHADGNLVARTLPDHRVLWAAHTHNNPGAFTMIGPDGNVVVYSKDNKPLYTTATKSPGASFVVNDDGNAVVVTTEGKAVWGTTTSGVARLTKGQILHTGQYRTSPDGRFRLAMGADGNAVLQNAQGKAIWSTGTHGNAGARLILQLDGNMVVQNGNGRAIWSTGTHGTNAAFLQVQNDGNLVLYEASGKSYWNSGTSGR